MSTAPKTIRIMAITDLMLFILFWVRSGENLLAKAILNRSVIKYEAITIEKKLKNLIELFPALRVVATKSQYRKTIMFIKLNRNPFAARPKEPPFMFLISGVFSS